MTVPVMGGWTRCAGTRCCDRWWVCLHPHDTSVRPLMVAASAAVGPWPALRHENFRRYFIGQLLAQTGRWMGGVAQAWLVLDLTASPAALGLLTVCQFAPILALSLFAGPIADRVIKRRLLVALQAAAAVQAAVLALLVLTGSAQPWEIFFLAALLGVINAIDNPTRLSFLSELVRPEELQSAVGLTAAVQNGARIAGAALGGLIIATWGTGICLGLNALAYVAAFIALVSIREGLLRPAERAAGGRMFAQVADGLRYVSSERELLVPLALLGLIGAIGYNWGVSLPILARYTFAAGAPGLGWLTAALGAGAIVGGLMVASRLPPTGAQLCRIGVAFSAFVIGLAYAPTFALALAALVGAGVLGVAFSAGVNTAVQFRSRPAYRGRVLGLFFLLWAGGVPIGGVLTGLVAELWDVRLALALNGVLCLAGSLVAVAAISRPRADPPTVLAPGP